MDLKKSEAKPTPTRSWYDHEHVSYGYNLIAKLRANNISDIGVLVAYDAHFRAFLSGVAQIGKGHPNIWDHVTVDKIDRRQGAEFNYTIVCLTNNVKPGFVAELPRLNTLLSRAKNVQYVLADARS